MKKIAHIGLIIIFSLVIVFHLLVLMRVIPFSIIGGGRVKAPSEMYPIETTALALNAVFLGIVLLQNIPLGFMNYVLKIVLWLMAFLFLLNTVGNLLSTSTLEKLIFTPVTILLCWFCSVLAFNKRV